MRGYDPYKKRAVVNKMSLLWLVVFIVGVVISTTDEGNIWAIILSAFSLTALVYINITLVIYYSFKCRKFCGICRNKLSLEDFDFFPGKKYSTQRSLRQTVCFESVCSHCGKTNRFYKDFTVVSIDLNGWRSEFDVEELAENYIYNLCN